MAAGRRYDPEIWEGVSWLFYNILVLPGLVGCGVSAACRARAAAAAATPHHHPAYVHWPRRVCHSLRRAPGNVK